MSWNHHHHHHNNHWAEKEAKWAHRDEVRNEIKEERLHNRAVNELMHGHVGEFFKLEGQANAAHHRAERAHEREMDAEDRIHHHHHHPHHPHHPQYPQYPHHYHPHGSPVPPSTGYVPGAPAGAAYPTGQIPPQPPAGAYYPPGGAYPPANQWNRGPYPY